MAIKLNRKKLKSAVEHIIYEFLGKGNLSKFEEIVSNNIEVYVPSSWKAILPTTHLRDKEAVKRIDRECVLAFQFNKVEIEGLLIGEDEILCRWSSQGIHKGSFFGIPPTQRSFHLSGQSIYQFDQEEQVCKAWQSWDMLGLLQQIKLKDPSLDKKIERLSFQEQKCLKYLLEGKTAKETAFLMNLSFRTVEYYFENIKNKLQCSRKRDLLSYSRLLENSKDDFAS